jgi:hypothetical protein
MLDALPPPQPPQVAPIEDDAVVPVIAKKRRISKGPAIASSIELSDDRIVDPTPNRRKRVRKDPLLDLLEQLRGARFDAENGKYKRAKKIVESLLLSQSYNRSSGERARYKDDLEEALDSESLISLIDEVISEYEVTNGDGNSSEDSENM